MLFIAFCLDHPVVSMTASHCFVKGKVVSSLLLSTPLGQDRFSHFPQQFSEEDTQNAGQYLTQDFPMEANKVLHQ